MTTLVIDVGGTHVKVLATGQAPARKLPSGRLLTPALMVAEVKAGASDWAFERVAIGYPGVVVHGRIAAEPANLGSGWVGFDFAAAFGCPVRIVNDAAMQALGSYRGGAMLFLGLGTGLGSAMIVDDRIEPMELAHLPYADGRSYEDAVGAAGLARLGEAAWRDEVWRVVGLLRGALQPDEVVLGGGNAHLLSDPPDGVRLGDNDRAFAGGFRLWERAGAPAATTTPAASSAPAAPATLGMIGLGRMGSNMVRRLLRAGHRAVAHDRMPAAVDAVVADGAIAAHTLDELVAALPQPRLVWLMVPAAVVDATLADLVPRLAPGDVVIDGGNSYYVDDLRRAGELTARGLHYVDVGTSGGVWGLDRGYCLMIGGEAQPVAALDPIFAALAPPADAAAALPGRARKGGTAGRGYLHCGPAGAGHFVKMVHNGIEYGLMASYAEGLNVLRHANVGATARAADAETTPLREPALYRYQFDLADVAEVWRRGSVIASWLLDLTAGALLDSPELGEFAGRVSDSGEGRWTVRAAIDASVPAPVLTAALYQRFASRGEADFADKVLSAMRAAFGGHHEKT